MSHAAIVARGWYAAVVGTHGTRRMTMDSGSVWTAEAHVTSSNDRAIP